MSTTQSTSARKRGPLAIPGRVRVTLYLDEPLVEWGKHQAGGLSDLVRRLLADAHTHQDNALDARIASAPYPAELRAAYQQRIDKKLRFGLTPEEAQELEQIRARINALDRSTEAWQRREIAAAAIDHELAVLRREIEALPAREENEKDARAGVTAR